MFDQLVQLVYSAQPDNISVYDRSCLPLSLTGLYLKMNGFELFHITCSRKDSRKLLNNYLIQFLVGLISTTVTNSKNKKILRNVVSGLFLVHQSTMMSVLNVSFFSSFLSILFLRPTRFAFEILLL